MKTTILLALVATIDAHENRRRARQSRQPRGLPQSK